MPSSQQPTPGSAGQTLTGNGGERRVLLLCNPRAGGRWKELATILDSPEAKLVRWIVTDSIEDVGPALASMSEETELLCVYGGDGTIQQMIAQLLSEQETSPTLAFIGGGTMNVTAGWCGWGRSPGKNFREVVQAYTAGRLLTKEVPLLRVEQGDHHMYGFIFGQGPIVRVLNEYEQSRKGILAALNVVARGIVGAVAHSPGSASHALLRPQEATIIKDGERLPYERYTVLFANTTGRIHIGVVPFVKKRTRETFFLGAYAISPQEVALLMPLLARGRLPLDPKALVKPVGFWKQFGLSLLGQGVFPADPRYVNDLASTLEVRSAEPYYTVDGEIVPSTGEPIMVTLGPYLRLVVHPMVDLPVPVRLAAGVTKAPSRAL